MKRRVDVSLFRRLKDFPVIGKNVHKINKRKSRGINQQWHKATIRCHKTRAKRFSSSASSSLAVFFSLFSLAFPSSLATSNKFRSSTEAIESHYRLQSIAWVGIFFPWARGNVYLWNIDLESVIVCAESTPKVYLILNIHVEHILEKEILNLSFSQKEFFDDHQKKAFEISWLASWEPLTIFISSSSSTNSNSHDISKSNRPVYLYPSDHGS